MIAVLAVSGAVPTVEAQTAPSVYAGINTDANERVDVMAGDCEVRSTRANDEGQWSIVIGSQQASRCDLTEGDTLTFTDGTSTTTREFAWGDVSTTIGDANAIDITGEQRQREADAQAEADAKAKAEADAKAKAEADAQAEADAEQERLCGIARENIREFETALLSGFISTRAADVLNLHRNYVAESCSD